MRFAKPDPIPLTAAKHAQLLKQQQALLQKQAEVLVRLSTAREQGDLSENGAYKYAKFELGNTRRELSRINYLLRWGVIAAGSSNTQKIGFGHTVTLKNDSKEITFMLVSQHESNPAEKKLSIDSPFGQAVVGKSLNQTVVVEAPGGQSEFTITAIT